MITEKVFFLVYMGSIVREGNPFITVKKLINPKYFKSEKLELK